MYRTRTQHYKYLRYLADRRKGDKHPAKNCALCEIKPGDHQYVSRTKHFKIVRNLFPYAIWDQQHVTDHMMIVPATHTDSLASLSDTARLEFVRLISEYESTGYHLYARATKSESRTIPHQHTHLIKCEGRTTKFAFYLLKPYVNVAL